MQGGRRFSSFTLFLAVVLAIVVSGPVIYGLLTSSVTIRNTGSVKAIGVKVYSDSVLNNEVSSIDWGTLELGSAKDSTVYVKNTGNAAVTLSLGTQNWSPSSASGYMKLTWNYDGQPISPDANVQVKLTLTIFANATGITSFSFDILITATG